MGGKMVNAGYRLMMQYMKKPAAGALELLHRARPGETGLPWPLILLAVRRAFADR
ncbi:MAG: hypothetical protein ACOYW4_04830 [Bacillota bacterium]